MEQILTLLGVGGIIAAVITSRLNKSNELAFRTREQKLVRYKSALLFMDVHLSPSNMKYLNNSKAIMVHSSKDDVVESLKAEYRELFLYASKDVIVSVKKFIDKPSEKNFARAVLAMRKDLGMSKKDLDINEISL